MKYFFLIIIIAISNSLLAQSENYEFVGILKIDGTNNFVTYKIDFVVKNGQINGYSYSDIGNANETHAKISGTFDGNFLIFEENEIVFPTDKSNDYCLLNFKGELQTKSNTLHGGFIGYLLGNKNQICGKGKLTLASKEKLIEIGKGQNELDTFSIKTINPLKNKNRFTFYTNDEYIQISLFDLLPDGDKLTMKIDNQEIFYNKEINSTALEYSIDCVKVKTIQLVSTSSGKEPPNTSEIKIKDSKREQKLVLDIEINESVFIDIIKL